MRRSTLWAWGPVASALMFAASEGQAQCTSTFEGLGDLPGGDTWSVANAVSADGSTVVGHSPSTSSATDPEAFRWTESTGMVGLGDFPGGLFKSAASGVSHDGSVIAGQGSTGIGGEAFRWTAETGLVALGSLGGPGSVASDVSSNGLVVVGWSHPAWPPAVPGTQEAFRWTSETGMVSLGHLPGPGTYSIPTATSADGSIVVGYSVVDPVCCFEAFLWTEDTGMVGIGDLPGGVFDSAARAISGDGSVVVGRATSAQGSEAFRWTQEGMAGLGDLPGGEFNSRAVAISVDGEIVVGVGQTALGEEAFIWEASDGMRNLRDLLVTEYGLGLEGWTLTKATGISADGLTIVGWGINPQGDTEAWIVRLRVHAVGDVDDDGTVDVLDLIQLLLFFGTSGGPADINEDGTVNVLDLIDLLLNFGLTCP